MNNLPRGVLPSDIPGESKHNRAYMYHYDDLSHTLDVAREEGFDVLHMLSDLVAEFYPNWIVMRRKQ